jgi:hypothetical protein
VTVIVGVVVALTFLFGFVRREALCFERRCKIEAGSNLVDMGWSRRAPNAVIAGGNFG